MKWCQRHYMPRSQSVHFFIQALLWTGLIWPSMSSAQQQQSFHSISYYKIVPGKEQTLRSNMQAVDAKVQQERVNKGAISGWYLYEVLSPSGVSAEYNYVVVTIANRYKDIFETPYTFDSALKKIYQGKDEKFFSGYYSRLTGVRTLVKEEVYVALAVADSTSRGFTSKYIVADFMQPKPEKFGQYIKSEMDTFRVIHKERVKLGDISQWACLQLFWPFDVKTGYAVLDLNFYTNLDAMLYAKYSEALKATFPTVDLGTLFQSVATMRDNPKADLWRLVLYALPNK